MASSEGFHPSVRDLVRLAEGFSSKSGQGTVLLESLMGKAGERQGVSDTQNYCQSRPCLEAHCPDGPGWAGAVGSTSLLQP